MPSRRPGRPTSLLHPQKRRAIVQAASRIFAEKGYKNASFASIAAAVDLTLPGLNHYFPRKTDLLLAVLEHRDQVEIDEAGQDFAGWGPFFQGLRALAERNASNTLLTKLFTVMSAESLTDDHPAQDWFAARSRLALEIFSRFFRDGIDRGEIRKEVEPVRLAAEIVAMMDGLQIWSLRLPDEVDMAGVFAAYLQRLEADIVI